jgi:hypothetical protein
MHFSCVGSRLRYILADEGLSPANATLVYAIIYYKSMFD